MEVRIENSAKGFLTRDAMALEESEEIAFGLGEAVAQNAVNRGFSGMGRGKAIETALEVFDPIHDIGREFLQTVLACVLDVSSSTIAHIRDLGFGAQPTVPQISDFAGRVGDDVTHAAVAIRDGKSV